MSKIKEEVLVKRHKQSGKIIDVAFYDDTDCDFRTKDGYMYDDHNLDIFFYTHLSYEELIFILNQEEAKEFLNKLK